MFSALTDFYTRQRKKLVSVKNQWRSNDVAAFPNGNMQIDLLPVDRNPIRPNPRMRIVRNRPQNLFREKNFRLIFIRNLMREPVIILFRRIPAPILLGKSNVYPLPFYPTHVLQGKRRFSQSLRG